ncbi:acyl-CoA dehydrogenase family protein [Catellatospora sp. KI3]|uniref:acyl-CoA dehydrogenase family protein n=1 Tax=Catellatospora sp. KI3 TaxID=3041620 RepID=UPI0024832D08|nr:acyl-CoA dehydrogenase family protein [Catellatospora sp. KI3]MDI1461462.1 acyl-CoA dehydrogenase family protein [Catellatospora sp. KI3]
MTSSNASVPTREELVERAASLIPLLRRHGAWTEANRRLHEEVVEALADAGLLRLRVPARFGGYEADTQTLHEVLVQLGRGDASVAWVVSVWAIPGWMVGMFPEETQKEVYSTPDVRVCGTLSPSAMGTPTDGGLIVNGKWGFISGALHSHWQEIIVMAPSPDGVNPWPVVGLVPTSQLQLIDDWHTSGLQGSGSITTVAQDLFVPNERLVPMPMVLAGQSQSPLNAELPMYRNTLLAVANAATGGALIGTALAAKENFLERLPSRKITYTSYEHAADAPVTHMQIAEASMKIDEADWHAQRITKLVDHKGVSGEPWTMEERARTRADIGSITKLSREAVDMLANASGGSSIYTDVPIQRIQRDMLAMSKHAITVPETNFELYGRILVGLEPNTPYV